MIIFFIPTGRKRGEKNVRGNGRRETERKDFDLVAPIEVLLRGGGIVMMLLFRDGTSRQRFNGQSCSCQRKPF